LDGAWPCNRRSSKLLYSLLELNFLFVGSHPLTYSFSDSVSEVGLISFLLDLPPRLPRRCLSRALRAAFDAIASHPHVCTPSFSPVYWAKFFSSSEQLIPMVALSPWSTRPSPNDLEKIVSLLKCVYTRAPANHGCQLQRTVSLSAPQRQNCS